MASILIQNIFRFAILIAMQVFLFKNIGYYNLVAPYPYVLAILLLPLGTSNFFLYALAFSTGLTIDIFHDTLGVHAAACTALALSRISFIRVTLDLEGHEKMATPIPAEVPFPWYATYIFICIFLHHLFLFILETFSFRQFHFTLLSCVLSCIFTVLIVLLGSLLLYRKKQR